MNFIIIYGTFFHSQKETLIAHCLRETNSLIKSLTLINNDKRKMLLTNYGRFPTILLTDHRFVFVVLVTHFLLFFTAYFTLSSLSTLFRYILLSFIVYKYYDGQITQKG